MALARSATQAPNTPESREGGGGRGDISNTSLNTSPTLVQAPSWSQHTSVCILLSLSGVWPERLAALPVAYSGQAGLDCGCAVAFLGGWPAFGADPVSAFVCRWMSVQGASGVVVVLRREYRAPLRGEKKGSVAIFWLKPF